MLTPQQVGLLMFRYVRNELTAKEQRKLTAWRQSSEKNERLFQEETDPENMRRFIREMYENREARFQKLMDRYNASDHAVQKRSRVKDIALTGYRSAAYRICRNAAIIVVSLGITLYGLLGIDIGGPADSGGNKINYYAHLTKPDGITIAIGDAKRGFADGKAASRREREESKGMFLMAKINPKAPADHYYTLRTEKAEQYGLRLPDSTRIWLNEKSSVKYPANYSADPGKISVEGEVYVELAENKNAHTPFFIDLQNMRLEISRGLFNIRAYPGDSVIITVIDGDVKLDNGSVRSASAVLLHPSEQAQIIHGRLKVLKNIDILKTIAWKHHAGKQ